MRIIFIGSLAVLACVLSVPQAARAQTSDKKVRISATAEKPDDSGKQTLTITLDIDPKWHLYANPVGRDFFVPNQTAVKFLTKVEDAKVTYPEGKLYKDSDGDFRVYEGRVVIKAEVKRVKGDTGPLEFSIKVAACDDKNCLIPATVKKSVP
jgi:DsbC/DsbD-like thiol-disulfide interchange protein